MDRGTPALASVSVDRAVHKERTTIQRRVALVLLVLLLSVWPFLAAAQNATPDTSSTTPLDLAAMALAPDDVPAGYFDDYSEWWVPADAFSALVLGGASTPPGLEQVYQTFYFNADELAAIASWLGSRSSATPILPPPAHQS